MSTNTRRDHTNSIQEAMRTSRKTRPTAANLAGILAAEKVIAEMDQADYGELSQRREQKPKDGHLRLWSGLYLDAQGQASGACEEYLAAGELGCRHWRVGWYLAQAARRAGRLELVDKACAAVLSANPDFWFAREFPKHARGYYGQDGHDKVIEKFFQDWPARSKVFVEVGAFDGVHYSNVRRLQEQYGWSGVSIEPVGKNFAKLTESYLGRNVRCVRAAVGNREGEMELHVATYPQLPEWGSDIATLSESETRRWEKYGAVWTKEKVTVRRLAAILDELGVTGVDLLSVDAEGHDLEVLQSLDFARVQPQLIVVEYGRHREAIFKFLSTQGYSLLLDNQQDLFMARLTHVAAPALQLPATRNFTGLTGRPGYEEIQKEAESRLHEWMQRPADEIERIVIVGGYLANEVKSFLANYPRAEIHIFEPSRRYFGPLAQSYDGNPRVHCHNLAVADRDGRFLFHEGTLPGVGSLLPLKTQPDGQTWLPEKWRPAEEYEVQVVTLDTFGPLRDQSIDLLWCDAQGVELKILRGAVQTLQRCQALFLEVATSKMSYEGQCELGELQRLALASGFYMAGIGLCPTGNGTGNALWLKTGGRKESAAVPPSPVRAESQPVAAAARQDVRLYYIPNGNDYHIAALLDQLFSEVKPFGCRDVADYIERRVLAYKTENASRQLWEEVSALRPGLVYVESGYNLEPAVLQRIRAELGIPVTMWFGDACMDEAFIERIVAYASCVDWQVVVDRQVAAEAHRRGLRHVEFIPFFGYDHYFKPLGGAKTVDVLFSGKSYSDCYDRYPFARQRAAFVRRVDQEFGGRLLVVGEGWEAAGLTNYRAQRAPEWEINVLNNAAKIVLAFDACQVQDFTSCRTYHALLGKSFVITRKFPGIEKFFVNGEHLVWFETEEEGLALLRYYLERPLERERKAQAGWEHVHRNGWKFSNVARYLAARGLKSETRSFEQIYAPYSQPLPQPAAEAAPAHNPQSATRNWGVPPDWTDGTNGTNATNGTIRNPQSLPATAPAAAGAISNPQSAIHNSQSTPSAHASAAPLVSAIVSTYNSERFMRGCLEDLTGQTLFAGGQLEIIVADSGSPQNERAIVEEFQKRFPNITYLRTEERETIYAAWNRAAQAARGRYLTSANTDDRHRPDALAVMAAYLEEHDEVALVYADQLVTDVPNETFAETQAGLRWGWPEYSYAELERLCIVGPQPVWRRSLHAKHGLFLPELRSAGDYEFWLRIGREEKFHRLHEILGLYYRNPHGLELGGGHSVNESNQIRERYGILARNVGECNSVPIPISKEELNRLPFRAVAPSAPVKAGFDPAKPDYSNTPVSPLRPARAYRPADPGARPVVTILTPFFNTGDIFDETAQSVLGQTFQQWEWLIVNDASTAPEAERVLGRYRQADPRIKVIDQPANRGPSAARNRGAQMALADYLVFLDSDDLLEPTAVEKWLWHLESHPEHAFVKGYSIGFGAKEYLWNNGFHNREAFLKENLVDLTSMIRKSAFHKAGGYAEEMRHGLEDWEFWLRCASHGLWGATVPEHLDWYRRRDNHNDRWSTWDGGARQRQARDELQKKYRRLEKSFPLPKPPPIQPGAGLPLQSPARNLLVKTKPRLLLILPWMTMGGADKFNLDLVEQLTGRGWEVTCATTLQGDYSWLPEFSRFTQDIFALPHFLEMADHPRFLSYLIQSRQIDTVLVSNSMVGYQLLLFLRSRFPDVTFLDYCHMEQEDWLDGGYPRMSVKSASCLDLSVVSSQHLKSWMAGKSGNPDQIEVCYTNIDARQWEPNPVIRQRVRIQLDLPDNHPVILYAGRIVAQKQPRVFAETMRLLRDKNSNFTAWVAGDGPDLPWLKEFVAQHQLGKNVRFFGGVPNQRIRELMKAADIFFLPSLWEGIALSIYEAMACGLAVVGADVGGQRELVIPGCGCLLPRGDPQSEARAYAAALAELTADAAQARALGRAARERVTQEFALEQMGERMAALIEQAHRGHAEGTRPPVPPETGLATLTQIVEMSRIQRYVDTALDLARKQQWLPALDIFQHVRGLAQQAHDKNIQRDMNCAIAQLRKFAGLPPAAPLVSVVIPCYNYGRLLAEAVESVLQQTFQDFEIIIVNDGSTDNTAEVANRLIRQHGDRHRMRLISQPNSGQPAAARNAGISAGTGEYVLPLDADDKIAPTFLEKTVAVLRAAPEIGVAYTHIQHFGAIQSVYACGPFEPAVLARDNVLPYCSLYRRRLWEEAGGYRLTGYEDWDFWLTLAERGCRGRLVPEPLFCYRKHGQGMLNQDNGKRERLMAQMVCHHPKLFDAARQESARKTLAGDEKQAASPAAMRPSLPAGAQRADPASPPAPITDPIPPPPAGRRRLRITYLISSILGVTGGNQTLLRQAEEMRRRGHAVTIVTYSPKPDWFRFETRVVQVPAGQPMASSVPPSDVVVATYFLNALELRAVQAPVRVYYAQGDQFVFGDATMADTPQNRQFRQWSRASYLLPGIRFVPNSRNLAGAVQKLCGRRPDGILPVCTDQTIFRPLQRSVAGSRFRLLIVGPDSRGTAAEPLLFKGMQDIHDALAILAAQHPHFTPVRMSGTAPDIFSRVPCEFYIAPGDEMKTMLFGTAHIHLYASHYDSCPRPPQEAMAAGCAVVCTATSGATEYCRDGENCLLVPVRSPAAMAAAVGRLIDDHPLREKLAQGGLATARQFPREREWNEWENMLYSFMDEAAQPAGANRLNGKPVKRSGAPVRHPQSALSAVAPSSGAKAEIRNAQSSDGSTESSTYAEATADRRPPVKIHPPSAIQLPPCALAGHLGPARELLQRKKPAAAWENAVAAIQARPFHPAGFLLLGEIAQAAGDGASALLCGRYARQLAPEWKPARKFTGGSLRGAAKPPWLVLPPALAGGSGAAPRLSVCLIVKDEEKFLGPCLASVSGLAAQIIVVDTGSTDRTVEIAREHGAEVHHFAWCDDFAAARNAALEHATGDWVLSLDADEELSPEHRQTILQEMQTAGVMGYRLPIINEGRETEGRSYVPRLFRNAPGLFYVGRVHEQVFSSIEVRCKEWGLKQILGKSVIFHHGYVKEVMESRGKIARNLRLLERANEELPGEPNLVMNLGLELVRSGQFEAGLEKYYEALHLMAAQPPGQIVPELRETLLTQLTTHLLAARNHAGVAELWAMPFAQSAGLTASNHFGLGLAYMELQRPAEAAEQMRQCLAKRGQPVLSPVNVEILKAGPHHCLALCLCALGQKEAAAQAFAAALAEEPASLRAGIDFARFQFEQGRPLEALKQLNSLAAGKPGEAAVWELGGQIALSRPEFLEFARDWTGEAVKYFPEHPGLLAQRAEALLLTQDMAGALPLWLGAPAPGSSRQMAAVVLCELLTGGCDRQFPEDEEASVSRELVRWYRQLIAAGAHSSVRQLHERMVQAREVAPGFVRVWEAATQQARQAMVAA